VQQDGLMRKIRIKHSKAKDIKIPFIVTQQALACTNFDRPGCSGCPGCSIHPGCLGHLDCFGRPGCSLFGSS
jgi:hypothetical protein